MDAVAGATERPCPHRIRVVTYEYGRYIREKHTGCQDIPECSITKSGQEPDCGLKPDMFVGPRHSYCGPLQVCLYVTAQPGVFVSEGAFCVGSSRRRTPPSMAQRQVAHDSARCQTLYRPDPL